MLNPPVEQKAKSKHKLVAVDARSRVHLCDVLSWTDDSTAVEGGISGLLEVTRRYTPMSVVMNHPRFRLTLSRGSDQSKLVPFLETLRRSKQAAVVILNKKGWVGYLVPHKHESKLYCHYHYQAHMNTERQQHVRQAPRLRMRNLQMIPEGPWSVVGSRDWAQEQKIIDGPDYDPGVMYTAEELDPYYHLPPLPQADDSIIAPIHVEMESEPESASDSQRVQQSLALGGETWTSSTSIQAAGDGLSAQAEAAAKYGEELRTEAQQASSFIYHLKRFNNWVKASLIAKARKRLSSAGLRVLDLACGKGGDLGKWASHPDGVEAYVGTDIAHGSLEHLIQRIAKSSEKGGRFNWQNTSVKLFEADLGRHDAQRDRLKVWENSGGRAGLWEEKVPLGEGDLFDVASMQFALHYMGQTRERLRHFLHEVSRCLRVGGIFIATTMDSRVLMQLMMGHAERTWDAALEKTALCVEIKDERQNNLLSIKFRDAHSSYVRQQSGDCDQSGPFGLEYTFTLRETELNKNAVDDVPEWMMPLDTLRAAAAEYGLDLVTSQNFHDFYAHESQADPARQNLRGMHVFNPQGTMNMTEWKIAGIYMALVFKKKDSDIQSHPTGRGTSKSSPIEPDDDPPPQYPPTSPLDAPPDWEGPPPKFRPRSPDQPPPGWGGSNDSAQEQQVGSGDFMPQSPTSPPPDDESDDSDTDDLYFKALAAARSAISSEAWDALSAGEKKILIDREMKRLEMT